MSTSLLKLTKNGETVTLADKAHIDAYKAKGWKEAVVTPKPRATKKEN